MLRGRWCILLAIAGLALGYPVEHIGYGQPRPAERNESAEADIQPGSLAAIENSIDRLTRAVEAGQREPQTETGQTESERDLAAQEGMWFWAAVAAFIAAVMALLTFIGLLLIWRTLEHTRRAADYAGEMAEEGRKATAAALAAAEAGQEANRLAIQTSYSQLRPWVKLDVKGITCRKTSANELNANIEVTITNVGATPALHAGVSIKTQLIANGNEIGPIDLPFHMGQFAPLFPGDTMPHGVTYMMTSDLIESVTKEAIECGLMPLVVFDFKLSYRAAFSEEPRETALRYIMHGFQGDVGWLLKDVGINEDIRPRFEFRWQKFDVMT